MSPEALIEKIKKDAKEKAQEIEAEREKDLLKEKEEYEKEKEVLEEESKEQLNLLKKEMKNKALSKAKRDSREKLEKIKRDILDSVFSEILNRLSDVSDEEYIKLVKDAIKRNIGNDFNGVYIASESKIEITQKALKELGIPLSLESSNDISGGVRCFNEDKFYDLSFESFIRDIQAEIEVDVSKKLFAE